jgi:serine protease Do
LDQKSRVGDWVVAVGNPFGLGGTATAGIVSAKGREIGGSNYSDFIQIDASINRGNSGGPTFDLYGQVIGVNTAIFSPSGGSVGIGFAIEANVAKKITDLLIKDGKVTRGWLGVSIQSLSEGEVDARGLESDKGALVADVQLGSPAEKSGIKRGDVILSVNDIAVDDSRELTRVVGSLIAGSENQFKIWRDGKNQMVKVTVGERPKDVNAAFDRDSKSENAPETEEKLDQNMSYNGLSLKPLDNEALEFFGLGPNEKGLFVVEVKPNSAFADVGIAKGDALLEAQGIVLKSAKDLEQAVKSARKQGKENISIAVRKGRATVFMPVEIAGLD